MNGLAALAPFPVRSLPSPADDAGAGSWAWRALDASDLPWLAALYATTRARELQPVPWPEAVKQQFLQQQFAAQHQHYLGYYPAAHYLAIEQDGQAVGRLYLDLQGADDLIVDISLLPQRCGAGLGTAVITHLQRSAACRQRGLTLHVARHNPDALRLYQRLGFMVTADDPQHTHLAMRWHPPAHA